MATAAPEIVRAPGAEAVRPADVLVVFGITGDLAKVMTFRSLYRLESRGLLDCPIVGVAVDDWGVDQLKERMKANPQDPKGWLLLGEAEGGLARYADSAEAYGKAVAALQAKSAPVLERLRAALAGRGS